ncbi:MFS transporter [Dokdonia sp.]|uniref:MFS transporter n=1 Tax=Dokdonia sp. TaxID=2024995 RepID=UPI003266C02F
MPVEHRSSKHTSVYSILYTISFAHFINDALQSVIPAMYPLLKSNYSLTFTQIGFIALCYQLTASLFQPLIGNLTDKRPWPFAVVIGALCTLVGIINLSWAPNYLWILLSVAIIGLGSSIFHPELSRIVSLTTANRKGYAQSVFQIGGNSGSAIGPLLVAVFVIPYGQAHVAWFAVGASLGVFILYRVSKWYKNHISERKKQSKSLFNEKSSMPSSQIKRAIAVLIILMFSKYFYMASMTNYLTFFLIEKFSLSIHQSQLYLFAFLGAIALGTYFGGPLGDKYGRKKVIWGSILGAAPFTLLLPYVGLLWVLILSILIGIIIASAFSAILVYGQELLPHKVGMISGLFFGLAFGLGGLGAALLGYLADQTSVIYIFQLCAFLPLLGIVTGLLPNLTTTKK